MNQTNRCKHVRCTPTFADRAKIPKDTSKISMLSLFKNVVMNVSKKTKSLSGRTGLYEDMELYRLELPTRCFGTSQEV